MKKMFFFALAAAGMLTACSNEDTLGGNGEQNVSEQQIRLGVASSKVQTRGTGTVGGMTEAENVWAGQTLWVYMLQKGSMDLAYYKTPTDLGNEQNPPEGTEEGTVWGTAVFNNKEFNAPKPATPAEQGVNSGIAKTADQSIAYYPVSGNYDFWGYRVDDAVTLAGDPAVPTVKLLGAEGQVLTDKEVANAVKRVVDIKINGSQDIMVGKATPSADELDNLGNYKENVYSAYAARKGVQPNITFNHLLTRFTFEVRAGSPAAAGLGEGVHSEAVRVKGVSVGSKLEGHLTVAYTEAAKDEPLLTFEENKPTDKPLALMQRATADADHNANLVALEEVALTWPVDEAGKPKLKDAEGKKIMTGDVIKVGEALLVAPGEKEYPLTIDLAQKVLKSLKPDAVPEEMELQQKNNIKIDGVKTFEPGKSYKVTITVYGLEEIQVTVTLVPWADGGSIDIDDDRNPNEGQYTEPTPAPEPEP
jgi:hypothetical protein